jgi:hypothetical protein
MPMVITDCIWNRKEKGRG